MNVLEILVAETVKFQERWQVSNKPDSSKPAFGYTFSGLGLSSIRSAKSEVDTIFEHHDSYGLVGRNTRKQLPWPNLLSTSICPPCSSQIFLTNGQNKKRANDVK